MSIRVKICGITNLADAECAVANGASAIGFVFYPGSRRYLAPEDARKIVERLHPYVVTVGVFVTPEYGYLSEALRVSGVSTAQIVDPLAHMNFADLGDFRFYEAIPIGDDPDANASKIESAISDTILLDTASSKFGGSGQTFTWSIIDRLKARSPEKTFIVAGGLNPDNVGILIADHRPQGVDVASGVESSPGVKDHAKITAFMEAVRRAA